MRVRRFPEGFLFGCATSAYQIEGGIENDWSDWEALGRLKDPSARCGIATDHWNRYEEDFALLRHLGAGAYRLSLEWARIEPSPGVFDEDALDRYARMIERLKDLGIEPFVTLLHFTHPRWFHVESPWHDPSGEAVRRFARFAEKVAARLGKRVRFWTVLNEPGPWLSGAYLAGAIPPGQKSFRKLGVALGNLAAAHAAAHRALKGAGGADALVGIAHNVVQFMPARSSNPMDRLAARYLAEHYNHAFLRALVSGRVRLGAVPGIRIDRALPEAKGTLDFIGVNYYSRVFVRVSPFGLVGLGPAGRAGGVETFYEDRGSYGVTDLGWEIHPSGLADVLVEMSRYRLPLYVTENGIDDRDDSRRAAFLCDHLGSVLDARDRGADVRGYLYWSLIDNFEWLEGFGPRFGLFTVDYRTLERKATASAELYRRIIGERALPSERPAARVKVGSGPTPVFSMK